MMMRSLFSPSLSTIIHPNPNSDCFPRTFLAILPPAPNIPVTSPLLGPRNFVYRQRCRFHSNSPDGGDSEDSPQDLRVPEHWLSPSKALEQESEWLRVNLRKWLDDEYCPEATNSEISKIAARSFYKSLVEKQTDLGEILLKMAGELESISYQESFHGAFSSANAAVSLIIQRMEQQDY